MPLIQHLEFNQPAIIALQPLQQSVAIKLRGWIETIGDTPLWARSLEYANAQGWCVTDSMHLDRQRLIEAATNGVDADICFLLDMLWGYGSGKGRGRKAVSKMLGNPDLNQRLQNGRVNIAQGFIESAFNDYKAIDGLGMSFITKVMYFESRAVDPVDYVPIFDNRVAEKLLCLAIDPVDNWLSSSLSVGRGNDWESYESYFLNLKRLSRHLQVNLEQLEYWLFL